MNEAYADYFVKSMADPEGGEMVGDPSDDRVAYNIIKISIPLKDNYRKEIDRIKEEISKACD